MICASMLCLFNVVVKEATVAVECRQDIAVDAIAITVFSNHITGRKVLIKGRMLLEFSSFFVFLKDGIEALKRR